MGKKNKTFKLKEYKVPAEKYLVVVNAWGVPDKYDNNTRLNEVGVWFQLLLKNDYPEARVQEIFYQKTHQNIIVVLPREIDITKYIGGYKYSQFHKFIPPEDPRSVFIYEYNFSKFGDPANINWTGIVPTYDKIPAGLLQILHDPFPFPTPAPLPPSDIQYARPIPKDIQTILAVRLTTCTSEGKGKGKSTEVMKDSELEKKPAVAAPPPKVGSSHYNHELPQVKKLDPYEEEEMEKNLLRSLSPVKNESNEATDFFKRIFPSIFDDEGDYKPSSELLDLFDTLPDRLVSSTTGKDVVVKSEAFDTVMPYDKKKSSGDREDSIMAVKSETRMMSDEEYHPSDELMAAFANLPEASRYAGQSIKQEPEGSTTARSELRVKEEVTEDQHFFPVPRSSQLSRDPRKRPMTPTIKNEREVEDEESVKRLKMYR